MRRERKAKYDLLSRITMIIILIISIYFILGEFLLPHESSFTQDKPTYYSGDWYHIDSKGGEHLTDVPCSFDVPPNETLIMQTRLDDVEPGYTLCFKSFHEDMTFYIDGVECFKYTTQDTRIHGKASPSCFVYFTLTEEMIGKTLRVELVSDSHFSGMFNSVLYGTQSSIYINHVKTYGLEILIAALTLVIGIGCILFQLLYYRLFNEITPTGSIGLVTILCAIWVFTNSALRQFVFPNLSLASEIPFFMLMLLPSAICQFINDVQKKHYTRLFTSISALSLINLVICSALHFSNTLEFIELIKIIALFIIITIIACIVTMIMDVYNGSIKKYKTIAIGLLLGFSAGIIEIILYLGKSYSFSGNLMCLALLFINGSSILSAIIDYNRKILERNEAINTSKSKAQFLANMSHEIRTPINAVLGMNEMILRNSNEANIREYSIDIQRAAQNLLSLVNDILDYSKLENKKLSIINVDYQLASVINDSYNMILLRAKEKNLHLQLNLENDIPYMLNGDEVRIRQIILNLLTNAVKYTKEGSVFLNVSKRNLSKDEIYLIIEVKDTGIGIKEEDQEKLFDSFQRVDEGANRNIEGTGLGLSIVLSLLELMNGEIKVESKYGVGSSFTVSIPQKIVSTKTINSNSFLFTINGSVGEIHRETFTAPEARILVVDDVEMNLKVFEGLLKENKIKIDTALSGLECIELIQKVQYDIIFLDHMMPEMNGIETFKKMEELDDNPNYDTPVIMLTANVVTDAKNEYLKYGFTDYLSKPINAQRLCEILLMYLPSSLIYRDRNKKGIDTNVSFIDRLNDYIDAYSGIEYYENNESFYREILEAYVEDGNTTKYDEPIRIGDWSNYQILIHALKSSSIYIGAKPLADEAKKLEDAAINKDIDYINEHHSSVMHMYEDIIKNIDAILKEYPE